MDLLVRYWRLVAGNWDISTILMTYFIFPGTRWTPFFADDIFKRIFLNENAWILIKISLKFVPKGSINNIPALVQIMAWRRPGDKPLSESMLVRIPTHICVTRPQWVNTPRDSFPGNGSPCQVLTACNWKLGYFHYIDDLTRLPRDKMAAIFCRRHFQTHFLEWKNTNFD